MPVTCIMKRQRAPLLAALLPLACAAIPAGGLAAQSPPDRVYIEHPTPHVDVSQAGDITVPGREPNAKRPPFSDAVRLGDTLYVAGHLGIDPKTGMAASDPAEEARLVMDAVKGTLGRAGFTMDELVSVTVYCTDLALYDTFNGIYGGYFHGPHPARAFIGVAKLVRGARFEVQGMAVKAGHK